MNKINPVLKKAALIIWAAAILWIYIGSLVNFHQHKIWGRPLLPQLLFAKRDKEKHLESLSFKITFKTFSGNDFPPFEAPHQGSAVHSICHVAATLPFVHAGLPLAVFGSGPSPLRAPPVA